MAEYAYAFTLYDNANVINEGYHYVVAKDIDEAQMVIKRAFPNSMILSYVKLSERPTTRGELQSFLSEWREHFPIEELKIP